MKKILRRWGALGLVMVMIMLTAAGCGAADRDKPSDEPEIEEVLYPITINGKEIRVGETKVQALLDDGFKVTVSEMDENMQITEYEIDPDAMLDANSYYTGGSVWITDSTFAHISIVTDEEPVRMGDAVIARLEFNISGSEDEAELAKIMFNGIPANELTRERAGEEFPDFSGDDNMWFSSYKMREYEYFMSFSEGKLHSFHAEKTYDVDWSSGE